MQGDCACFIARIPGNIGNRQSLQGYSVDEHRCAGGPLGTVAAVLVDNPICSNALLLNAFHSDCLVIRDVGDSIYAIRSSQVYTVGLDHGSTLIVFRVHGNGEAVAAAFGNRAGAAFCGSNGIAHRIFRQSHGIGSGSSRLHGDGKLHGGNLTVRNILTAPAVVPKGFLLQPECCQFFFRHILQGLKGQLRNRTGSHGEGAVAAEVGLVHGNIGISVGIGLGNRIADADRGQGKGRKQAAVIIQLIVECDQILQSLIHCDRNHKFVTGCNSIRRCALVNGCCQCRNCQREYQDHCHQQR